MRQGKAIEHIAKLKEERGTLDEQAEELGAVYVSTRKAYIDGFLDAVKMFARLEEDSDRTTTVDEVMRFKNTLYGGPFIPDHPCPNCGERVNGHGVCPHCGHWIAKKPDDS